MHRVLEFEDKRQEPEVLPLPEALSHSSSGSWKQLVLETGKPAWERDQRESPSELPEVHTVQQARQQVDHLQQQAYFETRKLQEAKFLARQAAEKLLAWQMHTSRPADQTDQSVGMDTKSCATLLEQAQALDAAQAHMLGVSEQVSLAELATELAEARAAFMEQHTGSEVPDTPYDTASSLHASFQHSTDRKNASAISLTSRMFPT
ncbi:hypothetical protein WJX82_006419 [Trebouxia sp. C0006]